MKRVDEPLPRSNPDEAAPKDQESGKARVATDGYDEDGANLVTLATNGWGKAEPAWWLTLQSNLEATVQLVDGPWDMRARVASGEERERLWA